MTCTNTLFFFFFVTLGAVLYAQAYSSYCYNPYTVVKFSDLALTVNNTEVVLQNFTRSETQLWTLNHHCDGTFSIISFNRCFLVEEGHNVTVSRFIGKNATYKWYINSDGTIVSAGGAKNLTLGAEDRRLVVEEGGEEKFQLSCHCCSFCYGR